MEQYIFRQATQQEIPVVFELIMGRVAWMDVVGIHQWNATKYDQRYPLHYYEQRRLKNELFVLEERATGEIVCVGALFHEDERWPDPASAYYLHHLASRVDKQGAGSLFFCSWRKNTLPTRANNICAWTLPWETRPWSIIIPAGATPRPAAARTDCTKASCARKS